MYDMDVVAFRAWLQSRPSYEMVGWVAEETACPVARWMSGVYRRDFRVSGSMVFLDDTPVESFMAPVWVPQFVSELDSRYDCHPVLVSAADVLAVLDEVLLEVGHGSSS